MINVGDILSTVGLFSTVEDIMSTVGVILSTVGDVQYCGDIMMHMGDIMSTMEGVQYRGGKNLLLFEYPKVLNTPHGTQDIPHIYHDIPHGTEHPQGTEY